MGVNASNKEKGVLTKNVICATVLLLCAFASVEARPSQLFAATTGNDTNPGSPEKPFATLERAQQAARKAAGREAVTGLKELIVDLNDQCKRGEYPAGELNNRRVAAVEEAIKAIEAATTQPELRSMALRLPMANRGE
jgi:hypothetical protein